MKTRTRKVVVGSLTMVFIVGLGSMLFAGPPVQIDLKATQKMMESKAFKEAIANQAGKGNQGQGGKGQNGKGQGNFGQGGKGQGNFGQGGKGQGNFGQGGKGQGNFGQGGKGQGNFGQGGKGQGNFGQGGKGKGKGKPGHWPKGGYHPKYHPWPNHGHHRPPVVYRPIIVETTPIYPQTAVSNPVPVADIQLINPAENQWTLSFRFEDEDEVQSLSAGYSIEINRPVVIVFDRGGGSGWARYQLTDGTYKFVASGGQWDLVHEASQVAQTAAYPSEDINPVPGS
ncbi:MAG: hypothetical protein JW719_10685 [Pirellulales bacterium]|nr:hypothetical protein [Pirellulales bacterium]